MVRVACQAKKNKQKYNTPERLAKREEAARRREEAIRQAEEKKMARASEAVRPAPIADAEETKAQAVPKAKARVVPKAKSKAVQKAKVVSRTKAQAVPKTRAKAVQKDEVEESVDEFGQLTVSDLKEILRTAGAPVSGRKAELVQRCLDLGI